MMSFREFMAAQEQPQEAPPMEPTQPVKPKLWKATKDEIVAYWKSLRPETPIMMRPVGYDHKGSTYGEDGIRITGSPQFIGSVLARLKEFLNYETPTTKLALVYRQTASPSQSMMGQNKTSYVFYIQTKERGNSQKSPKPPKPTKPKAPKAPKPIL
jgi:hypothetical protein